MTANEQRTIMDRLVEVVPKSNREQIVRLVQRLRDRLPPAVLEHRIEALERHVDRRLKDIDAKLDQVLRRLDSRAA